jgi:N-acyl homoserine lactone hydrolase
VRPWLSETNPIDDLGDRLVLSGDAAHFQSNWDNRRVPSINTDKDQTLASMQRIADLLAKDKAQLWINHDKAQRDTLKMAPDYYD